MRNSSDPVNGSGAMERLANIGNRASNKEHGVARRIDPRSLQKLELLAAVADILDLLNDFPSARGPMDEEDRERYRIALDGVRTIDDLRAVARKLRDSFEFRPIPDKLREIVLDIRSVEIVPAYAVIPDARQMRERQEMDAARLIAQKPASAHIADIRARLRQKDIDEGRTPLERSTADVDKTGATSGTPLEYEIPEHELNRLREIHRAKCALIMLEEKIAGSHLVAGKK